MFFDTESPLSVKSSQGEKPKTPAGNGIPCSRIAKSVAIANPPPAESPAIQICEGWTPFESNQV